MSMTKRDFLTEVAALFGGIVVASAVGEPADASVASWPTWPDDVMAWKQYIIFNRPYHRWKVGGHYSPEDRLFHFGFHDLQLSQMGNCIANYREKWNGFDVTVEVDWSEDDHTIEVVSGYLFRAMTPELADQLSVTIPWSEDFPVAMKISIKNDIIVRQYPGHDHLTTTWERINK